MPGSWRLPGSAAVGDSTQGEPVLTHGVPGQHAALITSGLVKVTLPSTSEPEAASSDKTGTLAVDPRARGPRRRGNRDPRGGFPRQRRLQHGPLHGDRDYWRHRPRVPRRCICAAYLAEHPAALWPVAAGLCERLADAEARIASAARDNADCRLARLLCDLERHGTPDYDMGCPAPRSRSDFSQAELASWIGSCRETVDRTLARWRRRGIISTRYRTIVVHDLETLARIAGIQVTRQALTRGARGRTRRVRAGREVRPLRAYHPKVAGRPRALPLENVDGERGNAFRDGQPGRGPDPPRGSAQRIDYAGCGA